LLTLVGGIVCVLWSRRKSEDEEQTERKKPRSRKRRKTRGVPN
jgi:hypothetical protein